MSSLGALSGYPETGFEMIYFALPKNIKKEEKANRTYEYYALCDFSEECTCNSLLSHPRFKIQKKQVSS